MPPSVVAIVLNFNRPRDTIECVRSIVQSNYREIEVVVVDNGSTDESISQLKKHLASAQIISTGKNLGFAGGMNFALQRVMSERHQYVLLLNNDTVVDRHFLSPLVEAMENNPRAAAACGTILCDHKRSEIWYAGGKMIPWRGLATHLNKGKQFNAEQSNDVKKVSFVTGCMLLIRTSMLETIGPFDERLFMFLEDIEFSARIRSKGFELLYVPQSVIFHKVLGESGNPFKLYYSVRNRLLVIKSSFQGVTGVVATTYFIAIIVLKLVYWRFTNPRFFDAAIDGLQDYLGGRFYEGRGFSHFPSAAHSIRE